MNILKLSQKSKTNPNIFCVHTDEKVDVFHAEMIIKYGISKGIDIDEDDYNQALYESSVKIATNASLVYLSCRLKSVHAMRRYLYQRGYSEDVIDECISKLLEYSILDDRVYSQTYVRTYMNTRSISRIRTHLLQHKIDREYIDELLSTVDDINLTKKLIQKYSRTHDITGEGRQKLIRHLSYKGISYDSILKALDKE